jgi:hypothetical protein
LTFTILLISKRSKLLHHQHLTGSVIKPFDETIAIPNPLRIWIDEELEYLRKPGLLILWISFY